MNIFLAASLLSLFPFLPIFQLVLKVSIVFWKPEIQVGGRIHTLHTRNPCLTPSITRYHTLLEVITEQRTEIPSSSTTSYGPNAPLLPNFLKLCFDGCFMYYGHTLLIKWVCCKCLFILVIVSFEGQRF